MAKSVTLHHQTSVGPWKIRVADVDITSFTASGEPATAADFELPVEILFVVAENAEGYVFSFDHTNSKFMAHRDNATAADAALEVASTSANLPTFRCLVFGR